ncbi:hypothetical protein [Arthrobacter crystallopoietes]|uniref:DUF8175 domain-containing protein n=1 Tax=Crystallibacter crystallopoietes TaxID=37928 RepID=A0A1H1HZP3_9MICC|nr:hypothetical protein [Arthrobacter crystallopoietes]AUI53730.1 hypothetical protein AC20117_22525 [Arthrobacter crystallopoietes]SDR30935.1 hypothetical protein SAMN04489742_4853 [Arthrobacter crystallopoietes]
MSGSRQENTEQNPFTRPGFITSAALILAIVAAGIVIFFVPRGSTEAQPQGNPAAPDATGSSAPASGLEESICGLPESDSTALGVAPKTTWVLQHGMAVPSDPSTVGPGTTDSNGLKSCFAHSPAGALYSAANIWATSFYGDATLVYQDLTADSPARDAALQAIKAGNEIGGGSAPKMQIQGFIIRSYSPRTAVVDLAVKTETGALGSLSASLVWEKGDWKLEPPAAGGNPFRQIPDMGSYIPWAGV